MAPVAGGQIHRDGYKEHRAGKSIEKCSELKAAEYTARNAGFNDSGELYRYNVLGTGMWAS